MSIASTINDLTKALETDLYSVNSNYVQGLFNNFQIVPHTGQLPPNAVPIGSSGGIGGVPSGTMYMDGNGNLWIVDPMGQSVQVQLPQPMTPEEAAKLKELREERTRETKRLKLEHFKKLPGEFRQNIINSFLWEKEVNDMNAIQAPLSEEEQKLAAREGVQGWNPLGGLSSGLSFHGGLGSASSWIQMGSTPKLPDGITSEDLIKAHTEATAEEQFLDSDRSE